ncbi:hypothetical protein LZC95_41105 [Pendulispora brunnea]|uniref:Tetratricopeptide repeat protein n=1 Tax=Pendulispora brunnea TaxID=2905690 RepID=A0ABZ2K293_9BACT
MKLKLFRSIFFCSLCSSLVLGSVEVRAAGSDAPAAQALFNEAKKLIADGKWAEACPKLEESQKLDPGIGTQYNLANCYEHIGRAASAWAVFLNVAGEAKAAGQTAREKVARDRATVLEARLAKLVITVRSTDVSQLKVTRDGLEVGRGQWGAAIPIDAGEHRIVASALGKKTWEKSVRVPVDGVTVNVEVPALQDDPNATTLADRGLMPGKPADGQEGAPIDEHPGRTQRIGGIVAGAVGIVGIGVGSAFGLMSNSKKNDSEPHCNAENRCDETGLGLRDDALKYGTISTIAFIAGGAALVGGVVLFVTAPKAKDASQVGKVTWQAAPMIGPRETGFHVQARW